MRAHRRSHCYAKGVGQNRFIGHHTSDIRAEGLESRLLLNAYVVSTLADSGPGSLRYEIQQANANAGPDSISFGVKGTITLGGSQLEISDDLSIVGPGAGALTISANNKSRVFQIDQNVTASISGVTITDGHAPDGMQGTMGTWVPPSYTPGGPGGPGAVGGGIYNQGTLTLSGDTISNNVAGAGGVGGPGATNGPYIVFPGGPGGPGGNGGGIYSTGSLSISNTMISGNTAQTDGGAIYNESTGNLGLLGTIIKGNSAGGNGGAIAGPGSVGATNCAISGNIAAAGGGIYASGILNLLDSTLSGNTATTGGGAGEFNTGVATAINCTISGNEAKQGDGGGIENIGTLTLGDCTVSDNTSFSGNGGGLALSGGDASIYNTIVALNHNLPRPDISGNLDYNYSTGESQYTRGNPSSNNLVSDGSGNLLFNSTGQPLNGNILGTPITLIDPRLTPLGYYGGPTQTMVPRSGSRAIDAGSNSLAVGTDGTPLTTDQRGLPRISNGTVDIGAVELQQNLQLLGVTVGDGSAQRSEVRQVTVRFNQQVTLSSNAVTLSLQNSGGSGTNDGSPPTDVSAALATPTTSDGGFTWVFAFLPTDAATVDPTGSLVDGIYTLTVHASGVTASSGNPLAGGDQATTFFRLFGDYNGDGTVNNLDYLHFKHSYGSALGDPNFNSIFNSDNNGAINNADYLQFKKRYGVSFKLNA